MKSKLFKILGVVAVVAMLASTLVALPASALSGVSLAATPTTISTASTYTVMFTLGSAITSNASAFVLTFDSGITVAAPTVSVITSTGLGTSSYATQAMTVTSTVGQVVTLSTVGLSDAPATDAGAMGAGTIVQLSFTAGITNPATIGSFGVTVKTSAETTGVYSSTITTTVPTVTVLPGVVSVYNSASILMSTGTSLTAALASVLAGGKITLTAGLYNTGFVGSAVSCTIQGVDANAANVILKSTGVWTMSGATVVIDLVTIDNSTGALTMTNATAGTVSNSYLKGGAVTFSGAGTNTVSSCTVTVATANTGVTATTATTIKTSPFVVAGTGIGISGICTVSGCTFSGAASTGLTTTGYGVNTTAGTSSVKTSTFSGLSNALTVAAGTVTFDSNTVDSCGWATAPTVDTIAVTTTTGTAVTSNKITNSKNYIINVAAGDTLVTVMFNNFSGNAKNANNAAATVKLNVTHNYWGGTNPADTTWVTYANPLGAIATADSFASAAAVDATATAGVNVINIAGCTLVGASALPSNPVTAAIPSTVTVKQYYDIFGTTATGAVDIKFFGTTANPITSSSLVYFYNTAWGTWQQVAGCTVNPFGNFVEVSFTAVATSSTSGTGIAQPSFSQLGGMPWALVTTIPAAPAAPAVAGYSPIPGATGVIISNASFTWTAVAGAATYNFVLSTDPSFAAAKNVFTASPTINGVVVAKTLAYNTTYYWEVQSADSTGKLLSAFTTSFFTTALQAAPVLTPALGAQGVSLNPTFTWSAVPGAVSYEFALAQEIGAVNKFDILDYSNNTTTNGITAQENFLYSTTYNWEYRSVDSTGAKSAWTVSFFTTMDKPAVVTTTASTAVVTTQPTIVITAATVTQTPITVINTTGTPSSPAIPSYLLWAVIAVGAVLVIAVIVLIVRTRRIP
jgi:hypothetical protein